MTFILSYDKNSLDKDKLLLSNHTTKESIFDKHQKANGMKVFTDLDDINKFLEDDPIKDEIDKNSCEKIVKRENSKGLRITSNRSTQTDLTCLSIIQLNAFCSLVDLKRNYNGIFRKDCRKKNNHGNETHISKTFSNVTNKNTKLYVNVAIKKKENVTLI